MVQMNNDLPPLIQALLAPQLYPQGVRQVDLVQTHISWVLLAGDFAYKIKKPIKMAFLDFSSLEQRRICCVDEVRLNRRFAPELYLEVVPISNTPQAPQFGGLGSPIEYAVKMHRFDEAGRLDRVCARGALQPKHLSDLAETLVAFHEVTAIAPLSSRFGSAHNIMKPARDNFHDLLRLLPATEVQTRLQSLQQWTEAQFIRLAPWMDARKQSGRVRECHGDLHLANLVLIDGRVRMFDCIEFNEDLRWIDVASEIAFTYVDLLAHAQTGLANWFVNEVLSRSGDYEAARLLPFYAVYRALVRAKVAALRADQMHSDNTQALAYIALAEQLLAQSPTTLLITHGLSGCGKTMASSQWLQSDRHTATLRLRSDVERKRLFGLESTERPSTRTKNTLYAAEAHVQTYYRLRELAEMLLRDGWSVIVDAAFLKRADRMVFRALARETGAAFGILAPQATPGQLRDRIQARMALGTDASDASLDVLTQQMQVIEPLEADELQQIQTEPA